MAGRRRPSSLYTFSGVPELGSGLAWRSRTEAFPDFEQIRRAVSHRGAQFLGILCSILLSYADNQSHHTETRDTWPSLAPFTAWWCAGSCSWPGVAWSSWRASRVRQPAVGRHPRRG